MPRDNKHLKEEAAAAIVVLLVVLVLAVVVVAAAAISFVISSITVSTQTRRLGTSSFDALFSFIYYVLLLSSPAVLFSIAAAGAAG